MPCRLRVGLRSGAMNKVLAELLELLALEPQGADCFVGQSHDIGTPQVFGGQVLRAAGFVTMLGKAPPTSGALQTKPVL